MDWSGIENEKKKKVKMKKIFNSKIEDFMFNSTRVKAYKFSELKIFNLKDFIINKRIYKILKQIGPLSVIFKGLFFPIKNKQKLLDVFFLYILKLCEFVHRLFPLKKQTMGKRIFLSDRAGQIQIKPQVKKIA